MYACADAAPRQLLDELRSVDSQGVRVELDHVKVPRGCAIGHEAGRSDAVRFAENRRVSLRNLLSSFPHRLELLQLSEAQGGLNMLLYQGARAFELWTGKRPPLDAMKKTLR